MRKKSQSERYLFRNSHFLTIGGITETKISARLKKEMHFLESVVRRVMVTLKSSYFCRKSGNSGKIIGFDKTGINYSR